jgi:hypothetical protein
MTPRIHLDTDRPVPRVSNCVSAARRIPGPATDIPHALAITSYGSD